MIRVVADTNVFVSALMFNGLPGSFLDLGLLGGFMLVTSPALLDELEDKLYAKFAVSERDARQIRSKLEGCALVVTPDVSLNVVKDDPDDNRVLECAVATHADYAVTGDKHLLKLLRYDGIPILSVRQFMDAVIGAR